MAKKNALIQIEQPIRQIQDKSLFDRVQDFLTEQEWEFRSNEDRGYFSFNLRLRDGSVRVVVDVAEQENWSRIMAYVIYPTLVPELKRPELAQALARINYTHLAGQFEIDLDDGEMRVRSIIESDGYLGEKLIDRALRRATDMAEQFQAILLSIAFGTTKAQDILKMTGHEDRGPLQ